MKYNTFNGEHVSVNINCSRQLGPGPRDSDDHLESQRKKRALFNWTLLMSSYCPSVKCEKEVLKIHKPRLKPTNYVKI